MTTEYSCIASSDLEPNSCSSRNTGITHIKVKEFSYKWIIKNFQHSCLTFLHQHAPLNSPDFAIGDQSEFACDLTLRESKDPNYYSIFLYFYGKRPDDLHVIISILNDHGKEAFAKRMLIDKQYEPLINLQESFDKFIEKDYIFDEKNKLLSNGMLTIVCKMCIYEDTVEYSDPITQEMEIIQPNGYVEYMDDLEHLLENNLFSDFRIIIDDKQFRVNKCILAARSRVFAAMLEHNMKESSSDKVEIHDIEAEVMQEMLRFIYAGKVSNIERIVPGLLVAAEKYELEGLKCTCQEILIEKLSLENVDQVLVLLDKMSAEKLKAATIEFIIQNSKALNGSEKFKKIFKSLSSSILADVTHALMMKL